MLFGRFRSTDSGVDMVSVVLMIYNQSIEDVLPSMASVVWQRGCETELIIADDGSVENLQSSVEKVLENSGLTNYKYIRSEINSGIVENLRAGVSAASGEVVKPLSPGDLLYSSDTLRIIEDFCCTQDTPIGFGKLMGYRGGDSWFDSFPYRAPTHPERYEDPSVGNERLLESQVISTDWVPGCSLFYRRDFILPYLDRLREMGVKFSEDLTCPLITLDGVRIRFLDECVLWYEIGSGVTTSGEGSATKRLYADHRRFFSSLAVNPGTPLFKRAYRLFSIRELVALKTPLYRYAQRLVQRRYIKAACSSDSTLDSSFETFFLPCRKWRGDGPLVLP